MLVRLFGSTDGGATWKEVKVDAAGELQIDVLSLPSLPAGQNNIGDVDVASIADGGFLFKVADHIHDLSQELGAAAGTRTVYSTAVPTGKIWVVQNAVAYDDTSAIDLISIGQNNKVSNLPAGRKASPAINELVSIEHPIILKAEWKIYAIFEGVVAGDNLSLVCNGYVVNA